MNGARRLLVTGVALTALLALVAVASRAHRPGGSSGGERGGHVPTLVQEYIGVTAFVLMLVMAVIAGWGLASARGKKALAGETSWRRTLAGIATVLVALAFGLFYTRHMTQNTPPRLRVEPPAGVGGPLGSATKQQARLQRREPRTSSEEAPWFVALAVGSVVLGVGIAVFAAARHRRRHAAELDEEAALARALDDVLADTLDDLRTEHDPRTAVIGAYARMERTFAAYRVPRDPAEAPLEYVARALGSLSVSAWAVRRLTLLFERAKFSAHDVDERMKEDAIETLAGLRAELEAAREEAA